MRNILILVPTLVSSFLSVNNGEDVVVRDDGLGTLHPTRVILTFKDECQVETIAETAAIFNNVPIDDTHLRSLFASNTTNSDEKTREVTLKAIAYLLNSKRKGGDVSQTAAAAANAEKEWDTYSVGKLPHLKMEIIEDPKKEFGGAVLASVAAALPCLDIVPERDQVFKFPELPDPEEEDTKSSSLPDAKKQDIKSSSLFMVDVTDESKGAKVTTNTVKPDDEFLHLQSHIRHTKLDEVWKTFTGSTDYMTVAVVDTGCSFHPDLAQNLWVNPENPYCAGATEFTPKFNATCYGIDYSDDRFNPLTEYLYHGTGVAGALAAATNNKFGIAGACWGCKIMCIKFVDKKKKFSLAGLLGAIDFIVKHKVKISNHSYRAANDSATLKSAFQKLLKTDHLAVVAAGNDNCNIDAVPLKCVLQKGKPPILLDNYLPARLANPKILTVGAINSYTKQRASFSSYGKDSVDVFAPGTSFVTTKNTRKKEKNKQGKEVKTFFQITQGTSFSAPLVAGIAALVWSRNPSLSAVEVKEKIVSTVNKSNTDLASKCVSEGYVDAFRAVSGTKKDLPRYFPTPLLIDRTDEFYVKRKPDGDGGFGKLQFNSAIVIGILIVNTMFFSTF